MQPVARIDSFQVEQGNPTGFPPNQRRVIVDKIEHGKPDGGSGKPKGGGRQDG